MKKWERVVDRLITDSIGNGDVSHLPGAGKRLTLKDEANTPPELRAAFKLMDDHNVAPEWIETGQRLEKSEAQIRRGIQDAAQRYRSALRRAHAGAANPRSARVEGNWRRNREAALERIERYNREVLVYNLSLPKGIPHRQTLRGEALIEQALRCEDV